jgi:carbon monoxide dehydrogenase subunit G
MGPISTSVAVDVDRERVFEFLCDLANREALTDQFTDQFRLERLPSSGVGAAARFRTGPRRARMWMETVVEELEAPHRIYERGRGGRIDRIPVFTVWELVEGPGPATEVRVVFWTEPSHPVDRLKELGTGRWYRRQWARALRRLKDVLESGKPVARVGVGGEDRIPTFQAGVR